MNINEDLRSYLDKNKNKKANIGVFAVGLYAYWQLFADKQGDCDIG